MNRAIYVPDWYYNGLPWWCIVWATVGWLATPTWYSMTSQAALYMYAGWLIYKRYIE